MGRIQQMLCSFIHAVTSWLEWQDAKEWAKEYHPGWVHLATKARWNKTRMSYRDKIIKAYRGEE